MIHQTYRDKKVVGVFVRFRAPLPYRLSIATISCPIPLAVLIPFSSSRKPVEIRMRLLYRQSKGLIIHI
jgi:hypothetical protein